jgi:MYXO-CTERM domain-containing protein
MEESKSRRSAARGILAAAGPLVLALAGSLLAACSELPSADQPEPPAPGALRGELVLYTLTFDDGTSDEQYFLRLGNDERSERRLFFAKNPELPGGDLVDVWGQDLGEGLEVSRIEPVKMRSGLIEKATRALRTPEPVKPRSFAFVLVDIGGGVNITVEEANRRLFSNLAPTGNQQNSVRQYFNEASYGRQDVAGQVFGPIPFTMTGCNTGPMATMLRPMIPGTFDHYLWYIGSRNMACGWSGLASGGRANRPSANTWYNASAGCGVLIQEPGHNFGMRHSAGMACMGGAVPFVDDPNEVVNPTTMALACTHSEYGDGFDPMGRGGCKHMNAYQKAYVGWLGKCNLAEVTSSGTYTLLPIELPCDGIQALQVPMPKMRPYFRSGGGGGAGDTILSHYYLELRAPHGMDRSIGQMPQVQVRVAGDTKQASERPTHTWFLDMKPAMGQQGLLVGESYSDPAAEIKFTVERMDTMSATVRIEIPGSTPGPATCLDNSTLMAPGPGPESCSPAPFTINGAPPPAVGDGGVLVPPPPPPQPTPAPRADAGAAGAGGSGAGGAGGSAPPPAPMPGAGSGGAPPSEPASEPIPAGCQCRIDGNSGIPGETALLLLGFVALLVRRRRR